MAEKPCAFSISQTLSTAAYIDSLLNRINAEINATGGYTYITQGEGIRTYDKAVSDPLVGEEADQVVEIKGGTIRIADSKTSQGEWEWKTVFTSGHISAELVTAANITTGYIGNSSSGSYWDLENNIFQIVIYGIVLIALTIVDIIWSKARKDKLKNEKT